MRLPKTFYRHAYKNLLLLLFIWLAGCAAPRPPALIPFADGEYWVLGSELEFTIRETGQRIIVPRGFVTDFASVPRVFWTFFPKHGEYTRAAIVHDYLYWQQQCSRGQADELFDIVMEDSDVDTTSRYSIYAAVRVWGGTAWEDNSELRKQGYVKIIPERYMNFPVKTRWEEYREFLHKVMEEERGEAFPVASVPPYCKALEEKDSTDKAVPAEQQQEPSRPQIHPKPDSAIGA